MPKTNATLTTLPHEIISRIFTLSSNPALVITCRELNRTLAPLSKSIATRIEFLLVRYRGNYVKAVVKGLRWTFFDLGLLNALDRIYRNERLRILETAARQSLISGTQSLNGVSQSSPQQLQPIGAATTPESNKEPPKKKRKKYHLNVSFPQSPVAHDTSARLAIDAGHTDIPVGETVASNSYNQEIPLPKGFPLPRRLFKSSDFIPLIQVLLSRGASPSYPSHYPLVRASQRGDVDMVRLLFEHGAPPEMKALRWACVEEMDDVLDVFLEKGIKPDGQCLSWCVEKGKTKMIDRLLKLGVVPDLKTVLGF
ncbi:hypothetical protein BGZ80_010232 [Entomortierella chlamydospora]|uniref:Uncharacterized protein n=1 Tax=Entomortierella chlamydospora TaxID=101097 RepID=A0A9P6MV59_9FUNG|nr:hypothetical protein BGZ80_010232 [Entomortierella chlamydospora]